jgi:hypothetical protein
MILRKSEGTLRREIKAGKVEAAQFPRNPDNPDDKRSVYRVLISDPPESGDPSESDHPPPIRQEAPDPAELIRAAIDPYVAMNQRIAELYAGAVAELREMSEERGRLLTELAQAITRTAKAEDELSHLRVDHRRDERLAEQMQRVANAQEARANELAEQLAAERARADAAEAERDRLGERRWRWWPW